MLNVIGLEDSHEAVSVSRDGASSDAGDHFPVRIQASFCWMMWLVGVRRRLGMEQKKREDAEKVGKLHVQGLMGPAVSLATTSFCIVARI